MSEDGLCDHCGEELAGLGSHYHCGNCGKTSSMMGHYRKFPDGSWGFSCRRLTVPAVEDEQRLEETGHSATHEPGEVSA